MENFFVGVLASIAATIVVIIATYFSRTARHFAVKILGKLVEIDIEQVYHSSRGAQKDIIEEVSKTQNIRLIMGRGGELQRETYARLLQQTNKYSSIKILLPRTRVKENEIDWVKARENEIIKFDGAIDHGIMAEQIDATVNFLRKVATLNNNFSIRRFNSPDLGKIVLTDNYLFYYLLKSNTHGRQNKMYRCKVGTETYSAYSRIYDLIWENSEDII